MMTAVLCSLAFSDTFGHDVRVTVEQQLPGNLSAEDWSIMREIIGAVRQAVPDAAPQACR